MAKPLEAKPPTSSVSRFFDAAVTTRVLDRKRGPANCELPEAPSSGKGSERTGWRKREFTLTEEADETFSQTAALFRDGTGTRMKNSHVFRAIMRAIAPNLQLLREEVSRLGAMRLPSNLPEYEAERVDFEHRLASAFCRAMQRANIP